MEEVITGIVDEIMVSGIQMNDDYTMQDKTVKLGAFCPISKEISEFYQSKYEEVEVLGTGDKGYLINSFAEIGWPDPFPTPQVIGSYKESFTVSQDKIVGYVKNAKEINSNSLVDDSMFLSRKVYVGSLPVSRSVS